VPVSGAAIQQGAAVVTKVTSALRLWQEKQFLV
jgi:hypothetical protein